MVDPARQELEQKYAAIAEVQRRLAEAPVLFYSPSEKQKIFHEQGKTKRRRLLLGGNRSGKTMCGRHEAIAHAYGYRFWEVPDLKLTEEGDLPPRDQIPTQFWIRRHDGIPVRVPNVGMVVSGLPRQRGIGQNIYPAMYEMLPAAVRRRMKVMKGAGGVPEFLDLPNGSRILFASKEQEDMTFEGFVLDWAWFDEPVRKSLFSAVWARLFDFQGPAWFTMTPLEAECAWLYQSWYLERPDDVGVVEVSMKDNPVNTPEMIQAFADNGEYTDREKKARLFGAFEFLGNRVLDVFDPSVHVCKAFLPPYEWIHGITVDPHHKRPSYMVWWAYNPASKTYHFYREWPTFDFFKAKEGGLTPAEYATIIRNAEGPMRIRARVCDPRFGKAEHQRHGFHETSWVQLMAKYGLIFDANVPNTGTLDYGHQKLVDLLRYDKNFPLSPTNHPRIYVHDGLVNMVTACMNYAFTDTREGKEPYQSVSDEFKDPVDAMRYTVLYPIPVTLDEALAMQQFTGDQLREANSY